MKILKIIGLVLFIGLLPGFNANAQIKKDTLHKPPPPKDTLHHKAPMLKYPVQVPMAKPPVNQDTVYRQSKPGQIPPEKKSPQDTIYQMPKDRVKRPPENQ